ncbi:MAG: class I SAM-dependent RNA methyltransferase [Planctomycetaceae bacterium]|nr:class I SAM-dependent RNA methyltransferase [Planctomycetaceae bacterium]
MSVFEFVAQTAFGLEAVVRRELQKLGYEPTGQEDGRVMFKGDASAICRSNLWLRSAERVAVVVGRFPARDFDELFDQIKELPWEEWIGVDDTFPVTASVVRSTIRSGVSTQKMVKRAIVERLRKSYTRHWFQESGPEYRVDCSIIRDQVLLTIDTTGAGLHKRGYRRLTGDAPLRETLAAAMVQLSYWSSNRFFIDPLCGTGTIPIEAALIGRNLAPGRNRNFTAQTWRQVPNNLWSDALQEAKDLEIANLPLAISGSDIDSRAIKVARQSAKEAGLSGDIQFSVRDFVDMPSGRDYGVLITNPPYGERMGDRDSVAKLNRDLGELMTMLETWSYYILTAAPYFERQFGKRADRRRKLYNGNIECTFYQYTGPKPPIGHSAVSDLDENPID